MTLHSIDISNWTGRLSPQQTACLHEQGVQHVVVRASLETPAKGDITRQQLDALAAAGIDTSVYLWMYPSWSPEGTVQATVSLLGDRPCRWFWIDAEETEDLAMPAHNEAWLHRALAAVDRQGRRAGLYSAAWWWNDRRYMNGSTAFRDIPLWAAQYDRNPSLAAFAPFGGWSVSGLYGKQYEGSGTAAVCGLAVDLNTFVDAVGPPAPPPPPPAAACLPLEEAYQWQTDDVANAQLRAAVRVARLDELAHGGI